MAPPQSPAEPFFATESIASRPPPVSATGMVAWLRQNLFSTWYSTVVTVLLLAVAVKVVPSLVSWAFLHAVWGPQFEGQAATDVVAACRAAEGACWAFISEKRHIILFGLYPYGEEWRGVLAMVLFVALAVASTMRRLWGGTLIAAWLVVIPIGITLMYGALPLGFVTIPIPGLSIIETRLWGGLPLTIGLSMIGLATAFPFSILLALGRCSNMPMIRAACITYIELFRGVPLVTVLFLAAVLFPLFLPEGLNFDYLLRAQIALSLFTAPYLAEVVRGGIQAIPRGQYEAADSMGLGYWQKQRLVVLPQALTISIPALVNTFIGCFMDTTLVIMIGLFDVLGAARLGLADAIWGPFYREAYIFVSLLFFILCFCMSKYAQTLEVKLFSEKKNR